MNWVKEILGSVLRLGTGELVARLASFVLMAYISRRFGLQLMGTFALAQTVALYVTQGTDQGFRLIGARVVARNPAAAPAIVPLLSRRRIFMALMCVAAGLVYAIYAPMPTYARFCVAGFVIGVLPYALSLDWLAWGLSHFGWLGSYRAGIAIVFAAGSLAGFKLLADPRASLMMANFASAAGGALVLWWVWRSTWKRRLPAPGPEPAHAAHELRWGAVLALGLAVILTQMFHNADTLILAAMAPLDEVGRYNAAYKILFLICGGFYLLTQAIYPRLAGASSGPRTRHVVLIATVGVAAAGLVISAVLSVFARPVLSIIYGSDFGATHLLRVLVFAIPMDFVAALLGVCLTSRGHERFLLFSCGGATCCNIVANLVLIPRMGAAGAALATLASYLVMIVTLFAGFLVKPVFTERLAIAHAQAGQD